MTARPLAQGEKPSFIWWDQDVTEADVREALAGDDLYARITYLSYIVNDASFDDVWRFVSIDDVRRDFWRIRWRSKARRDNWRQALTLLGYPPDECTDPRSARILA